MWIFGIDRSVQNIVGAADYGMYYALFNLSLILNIILDLGLTNYNNREISRHPNMLVRYLSNIVGLKLVISILYAITTLVVAFAMGYKWEQMPILLLLIANQFLSSFILYMRSNLNALQFFAIDSFLSILDKLLMVVLCGIVIWGNLGFISMDINVFVVTQTLSYVVAAIIATMVVVYKGGKFSTEIKRSAAIALLKQSLPYAMLILLMATYSRMDIIMVERLLPDGSQNAGIYAQAFRLVDAYNMFPFLVAGLLLPIFSKMIKEQQALSSFVEYSFNIVMVPVLALALCTFFFRDQIMQLLYNNHVETSAQVLGVLMGSFVFISINYVFGTLLTAQGAIKNMVKISLVVVLVGLVLQLILVKNYGVVGAALGNLSINIMATMAQMLYAIIKLKLKFSPYLLLRYVVLIVLSVAMIVGIREFSVNISMFVVSCLAIVLLAFLLKLIKVKELLCHNSAIN